MRGFTLIELLIGLAILGLMTALMAQIVPLSISGAERVDQTVTANERLRAVHQSLRRQIESIVPVETHDLRGGELKLEATDTVFAFPAPAPQALGTPGPVLVRIAVVPAKAGGVDVVYQTANIENETVLVKNARSAGFAYFGPETAGGDATWHEKWSRRDLLPSLVRLRVTPSRDGAWPDLVVAPRAQRRPR